MADLKSLGADARITALGVFTAADGRRIALERLELDNVEGALGTARYRARDLAVDGLETRLGNVQTNADALTLGGVELHTGDGALQLTIDRVGFPRGFSFTRDTELFAPHASFEDVSFAIADVWALLAGRRDRAAPREDDAAGAGAGADRPRAVADYRFLDTLEGHLNVDLVVDLTLPWIGRRKATHYLRIPIKDGTIDFDELEDDVHWLESTFLDLEVVDDKLVLERDLPFVPFASKALMWWRLEPEDVPLAQYRRVHLRNLLNFEFPSSGDRASKSEKPKGKSKLVLHELSFDNCSIGLATAAPAQIELAGGALIQLGGDEQTGLSDLSLTGAVRHRRDGEPAETALSGRVGQLDATLVDVPLASVTVSADRLHVSALDGLKLAFEGPRPRRLTGTISRLAATNLRIRFGGAPRDDGPESPPGDPPEPA